MGQGKMGENLTRTLNITLYSDKYNNYIDVNQGLNIWHLKQELLVLKKNNIK